VTARQGLRERKKAETRTALSRAAMRLAAARGVEAVTAEEVAAAANVSTRTFHNYFASKEEAIVAPYRELIRVAAEELRDRPLEEPILESLERIATRLLSGSISAADETTTDAEQLWMSPRMASYRPVLTFELIRLMVGAVAERTGTDARSDLYPALVTAVAAAAILTVLEIGSGDDRDARAGRIRESFALLRAGFPLPKPVT
jgi:AcrR family transcriptional regulator